MKRRDFIKSMGLGAMSLTLQGCVTAPELFAGRSGRPNIIFILADDLGYGDLGCYGQQEIATPSLDRMADEGMRFTDHYAGSTVCAPSRCVLMTGLHSGHALVRGNARIPLRPSDVTVAELLNKAGYATGIVGKWGLGEPGSTGIPNKQGFDYWFGYLNQRHAHNYYPEYLWRNEQKVPLKNQVRSANPPGGVATKRVEYSHDLFAKESLAFVEKYRYKPFFLYLAYTIPHANNEAGRKGMEVPDYGIYKDKDWPEPQKGHAAMITRMDADIGRLFAKLRELGIDKNTFVMFSSDNGPHREGGNNSDFNDSNGPLRGIKRDLYEGGIRVPTLARWPGKIKAGSVSGHISAFSMVPTLMGQVKKQKKHEFLYWEFHEQGKKQAVRMGDFKGVRLRVAKNPNGPIELYNLKTDIGEKQNIANRHPKIVVKIAEYMKTARTPSRNWPLPSA
ncbi:MAG: arylsulfatase [Planctomycetota bacterium]|jgi:arylsulfatase A-like enzyme